MTKTFNFTTNIEKRMPTTGKVYFVNRMTSDYAVQHPFDVDGYLEQVYQKWQDCETIGFRETSEALRRQWDATLGCRNPRGDARLYPNKNGEKHPALMEVWLKAGDYWRRGLRLGDVLPAVVPPCKITRTEDGWIALFPKDLHLLESSATETDEPSPAEEPEYREAEKSVAISEPITNQREENRPAKAVESPNDDDELTRMLAEIERLRNENDQLRGNQSGKVATRDRRRKSQEREAQRQQAESDRLAREAAEQEAADREQQQRKVFAAVGAVAVTLLMIHFFGLLGPAVFGLIAGGLLKG